ncbi:glycosyltransferase [Chlorobium sp. BLA1]|uniref:glycosyltransferase family 2 protein n=1 Tax=Candidatus Chlorobium masyuteum TaxID=2716876 RepID=UPI001421F6CD|nr:glycosyltransferase [Candidatus Chlorobium masyuteum]NHQ59189.1 glycosyltransferase [Candidatus Chlorobium masyuteum]
MKPFFSVIIPTYNRAEILKKAIDSVLAQTFNDYEILVMDDGSTDNTRETVESFHDFRIYYHWAENSGGPATPRNRGIEAAQADWICFLDADDLWYPDKLKILSETINSFPDIDLFCHNEMLFHIKTGRRTLLKHGPDSADIYRIMLMEGNRVSTSATTVRRSFLNKYALRFNQSSDYVIVEDYDMWLRIACFGGQYHFISDICGEYIIDTDNISSDYKKMRHNHEVLLKDHVYYLQTFEQDKNRLWGKINARLLLGDSLYLFRSKKILSGISLLLQSIQSSPIGFIAYINSNLAARLCNYID